MAEAKKQKPTPRKPSKLISKKAAAELLGRTEIALYRLTQKRKIPFYKVEGVICFDSAELLEWAAQYYQPVESDS